MVIKNACVFFLKKLFWKNKRPKQIWKNKDVEILVEASTLF